MKGLTIQQPFASLIVLGAKTNETRSWNTKYLGPLAIHVSLKIPRQFRDLRYQEPFCSYIPENYSLADYCGCIIAVCKLIDCCLITETRHELLKLDPAVSYIPEFWPTPREPELSFGDYTPGRFALILADVHPVDPVKCKGMLGLWDVPEDVEKMMGIRHIVWDQ
jgi:hypothetical protein